MLSYNSASAFFAAIAQTFLLKAVTLGKMKLNVYERNALRTVLASCIMFLFYSIKNNWCPSNSISGFFLEFWYIFILYMYVPFEFSLIYLTMAGYIIDLKRGVATITFLTVALLLLSVFGVYYVVFALCNGIVLIISFCFLVSRLLWTFVI